MSGRLVGVLGGVGPGATAYFLQRIVERTEAACDQDHVRTLAFNDTAIPDRTAFIAGESARSPVTALIEDGQLLAACGCEVLALPCNTAHTFYDEVSAAVPAPIVHMVRETVRAAADAGLSRLGVLATRGTVLADVYGREGAHCGVGCRYPAGPVQQRVGRIIFDEVKAGRAVDRAVLDELAAGLADAGCDGIVLGCTELSLAFGGARRAAGLPVVDALDVLADRVIALGGGRRCEEETDVRFCRLG